MVGISNSVISFMNWPFPHTTYENNFFMALSALYAAFYFFGETAIFLKVEALNGIYFVVRITKLVVIVYVLTLFIFIC